MSWRQRAHKNSTTVPSSTARIMICGVVIRAVLFVGSSLLRCYLNPMSVVMCGQVRQQ
jgi:hypothetical protein